MKIWIDLTDFLNWRGNLTGIQRIQFNISKLYIESGKDVHFFVYREQCRDFKEVIFNPEDVVRAGIVVYGGENGNKKSQVIRQGVVGFTQKAIPLSISKRIKSMGLQTRSVVSLNTNCIFSSTDSILIMGGIWAGNYIDDLEILKQKHKFKLIHFAFDMIPSFFPGYVVDWLPDAFNHYFKKVYSMSEGIVAISESTANDARRFMKLHGVNNDPKIKVVRIGEGMDTDNGVKEKSLFNITGKDFILSVSTVEGRKNHVAFFYLIKEAKQRDVKLPKIIIVGRDGWLTDDIRYMMKNDIDAREKIILLNNVDDNELNWLYKNCLFTVFPSFYEGWGMPVAESLAYGKLCLSSNTSSMPEIAGDLIDYFSPYDTGAMLNCIQKYLKPDELKKKVKKISAEYHRTSWVDMYLCIDEFIETIIATSNS